jgi:hypothetical protein
MPDEVIRMLPSTMMGVCDTRHFVQIESEV